MNNMKMSFHYDDSVADFDLDFLQHTPNKTVVPEKFDKIEKCRKAIGLAKKKIIATDSLIRKYYEKKDELDQIERMLYDSKEESKIICIDLKKANDKCTQLENEAQILRIANQELQEKFTKSDNLVNAVQCHANQLQMLVTKNEKLIETLKIENQLGKDNVKECEKRVEVYQKENVTLKKHIFLIKDIVLGKKKLNKKIKAILLKYDQRVESDDNDSLLGESNSEDERDNSLHIMSSAPTSPGEIKTKNLLTQMSNFVKEKNSSIKESETATTKDDNEHDSDFSNNEIASADTGRGSSLAFSDGEKCFHSPEYFMHNSPINGDLAEKTIPKYVDVCTSPITVHPRVHMGTSPVNFSEQIHITKSPSYFQTNDMVASPISVCDTIQINISPLPPEDSVVMKSPVEFENTLSSPIHTEEDLLCFENTNTVETCDNISQSHSDLREEEQRTLTLSKASVSSNNEHPLDNPSLGFEVVTSIDLEACSDNNITEPNEKQSDSRQVSEKECLDMNKSNNLDENNSKDCEIETIFNSMRLNYKLLTPIPTTPTKLRRVEASRNTESRISCSLQDSDFVCKDAAKLRDENKKLHANIAKIFKEIESIKYALRYKRFVVKENQQRAEHEISYDQSRYEDDMMSITSQNITTLDNNDVFDDLQNHDRLSKLSDDRLLIHDNTDSSTQFSSTLGNNKSSKKLNFEDCELISDKSVAIPNSEDLAIVIGLREDSDKNCEKALEKSMDMEKCSVNKCKKRKLSKLEKLRHTLRPKSKIQKVSTTPRKKKFNFLVRNNVVRSKNVKSLDTAALLNNRDSYEKARKIMLELRSKNKIESMKPQISPRKEKIKLESSVKKIKENKVLNGKKYINDLKKPEKHGDNEKDVLVQVRLSPIERKESNDKRNGNDIECESSEIERSDVLKSYNTRLRNSRNSNDVVEPTVIIPESKLKKKHKDFEDLEKVESTTSKESAAVQAKYADTTAVNLSTTSDVRSPTQHTKDQSKELRIPDTECHDIISNNRETSTLESPTSSKLFICTRSRSRSNNDSSVSPVKSFSQNNKCIDRDDHLQKTYEADLKLDTCNVTQNSRKRQKGKSIEKPEIECKRMLRSSTLQQSRFEENNDKNTSINNSLIAGENTNALDNSNLTNNIGNSGTSSKVNIVSYDDLDLFEKNDGPSENQRNNLSEMEVNEETDERTARNPKESIFCVMLDKYGKQSVKNFSKKIPDNIVNSISKVIECELTKITELSHNDVKASMNKFVETIRKWKFKEFIAGLVHYLKDPQRKVELFNKVNAPPAPSMTKSEQILLYVITQLRVSSTFDVVDCILCNIEYVLLKLNRTPEFDTIDSMSHFYAVLCRYFKMKSRLRLFMLDAMYCIQFKAIPLIKQCLDVWMHVLPLAHMGIAKCPIVICMVYLLHFYKCDDKFNRVQEIRNILNRRYFYEITEWNEPKIIEMFKNAIKEVKAVPVEKKLLRLALIVIAKRHGPKWCQNVLIKNVLLPMIDSDTLPERVKVFCVSVLGPLLKPYPADMKIHSEIIMNLLMDMLNRKLSPAMEEAIFISLIYMSRHNHNRVIQALLTWKPKKISDDLESVLRDFVNEKSLKMWKTTLSKIPLSENSVF